MAEERRKTKTKLRIFRGEKEGYDKCQKRGAGVEMDDKHREKS